MTELLTRYPEIDDEQPTNNELVDDSVDTSGGSREVSPTGSKIVRAAERINTMLENRAIGNAYVDAHIEDRARSNEVDSLNTNETLTDREKQIELTKAKIRSFGRAALTKVLNAPGDLMMAAGAKAEQGMDSVGTKMVAGAEKVRGTVAGVQLKAESNWQNRQFKRDYKKEMKAFDKNAEIERKDTAKQDKKDIKEAAREDERFERSMRKKAALERRTARREKWSLRREKVIVVGSAVKGLTKDALDSGMNKYESAKNNARVVRTAGRMAIRTFKDTRTAFAEDKKA